MVNFSGSHTLQRVQKESVLATTLFLLYIIVSDTQMILKKEKRLLYNFADLQIPRMHKSFYFLLLGELWNHER